MEREIDEKVLNFDFDRDQHDPYAIRTLQEQLGILACDESGPQRAEREKSNSAR